MAKSRDPSSDAKRRREWQEADGRRKIDERQQMVEAGKATLAPAANTTDVSAGAPVFYDVAAANRHIAALTASLAVPGIKPTKDIEAVYEQLNEDYNNVSYKVATNLGIPEPARKELAQFLQVNAKSRIEEARRLVNELKRRLQGKDDLTETKTSSLTRSAILTVTQQLEALNRKHLGHNKAATTGASGTAAEPTVPWKISKLHLADSLNLNELLEEFKIAAEKPNRYVEIVASLREQLRVATSSQWKAEKDAQDAKIAASQAQTQLGLADIHDKNYHKFQDHHDELLLQLEQCHQRGEERKQEIIRLRREGTAPKPSNAPDSPHDDGEPFTRQEARTLLKLIEDFTKSSGKYQRIIKTLQKKEDFCAEAKKRLQDQIDKLEDQNDLYQELNVKVARLKTENESLRSAPKAKVSNESATSQAEVARETQEALDEALAARLGSPDSEELPKQIADLKAERDKAASDLVDVAENLKKIKADLKVQTDANALLRVRLDHEKQEAEEDAADLEGWHSGLEDANDSLQQLADDLEKERNVAVAELERTKKALEECLKKHGGEEGMEEDEAGPPPADDEPSVEDEPASEEEEVNEKPSAEKEDESSINIEPASEEEDDEEEEEEREEEDEEVEEEEKEEPPEFPTRRPPSEISEDTPDHTPGGTKRKFAPGVRLRRETRANKRRAQKWYTSVYFDVHEPSSP